MASPTPRLDADREALRQRLSVAAPALGVVVDEGESTAALLERLATHVADSGEEREAWLLFIALMACFPTSNDVADLRRRLSLSTGGSVLVAAFESTLTSSAVYRQAGARQRTIRLVEDSVVVDVNFCATHEHNSGIQRVVRESLPRWTDEERPIVLVAWTADSIGMRDLTGLERERVLNWNERDRRARPTKDDLAIDDTLVVPWNSHVFLPEVPLHSLCGPLAAMAETSGNSVSLIGYDTIPLVSADTVAVAESERFAAYLAIIKHADHVVAISESAANEFRGFVSTLEAQGLRGPRVTTSVLPSEHRERSAEVPQTTGLPLVLCIGSHEARKNQEAVLFAGEMLFREGVAFRLVFVGNGDRAITQAFDARAKRLRRDGFAVETLRGVGDTALWDLYSNARFSVFVSLHEGYGLPVAESLAFGTPVLTSNFGSVAEIAAGGGCVVVDPRSDSEIIDAMRELVTDDSLIEKLRIEIDARPERTWTQYADELWELAGLETVAS